MPFGIPEQLAAGAAGVLADRVFGGWALPAWASRTGFRLLDPVKSLRSRIEFILQLHDREALLPRERQRRFLEADGWVAWPGPAMADFMRQFVAHNRMLEGGFVIEDRLVTLADIDCPILSVVGTVDEIAPAAGRAGDPSGRAAGRGVRAGAARRSLRPRRRLDVERRSRGRRSRAGRAGASGDGELPEQITPVPTRTRARARRPRCATGSATGSSWPARCGTGMARSVLGTARRTVRGVRELTREAAGQLPRLARLEQIQPSTRISLGLLRRGARGARRPTTSSSCSRTAPTPRGRSTSGSTTWSAGLISIGVRQGEHVGVLMGTRPSALALAIAISRLGAVSVLLRPGRRRRARGRARPGRADHRRPRARPAGRRAGHACTRSCSAAAVARASSTCR